MKADLRGQNYMFDPAMCTCARMCVCVYVYVRGFKAVMAAVHSQSMCMHVSVALCIYACMSTCVCENV